MVTKSPRPSDKSRERRNRAQLLLVGSLLIAAIIIGLVVVINTVLVTENVATGEALDRARDTAQFDLQARENVRSLVLRLNHDNRTVTAPQLTNNVERNFSNYSNLLAEAHSLREPIWVDISYDNDSSSWGQRIVQDQDGPYTSPSGDDNWEPVSEHRDIGRFVVNLNVSETSTEKFHLSFTNESGESINVSLWAESAGSNSDILINSPAQSGAAKCDPANGRVLLDMLSGTAFTGDCEFEAPRTVGLGEPYNLTVTNGSHAYGKFGLVVNESASPDTRTYSDCESSPQDICTAPIIWSANATVQYESSSIVYEQEHNVSVYP
ncbi:hypothetical protein [Halorientalis salina]|uniref:hypothetical protein n=1 Tax=Halorientalis salina TaxID=2932266 RepID=UPI0010ACFA90|nr:hypothetical protein [Halorientalis salina]